MFVVYYNVSQKALLKHSSRDMKDERLTVIAPVIAVPVNMFAHNRERIELN